MIVTFFGSAALGRVEARDEIDKVKRVSEFSVPCSPTA
jgi:hypothetical protein